MSLEEMQLRTLRSKFYLFRSFRINREPEPFNSLRDWGTANRNREWLPSFGCYAGWNHFHWMIRMQHLSNERGGERVSNTECYKYNPTRNSTLPWETPPGLPSARSIRPQRWGRSSSWRLHISWKHKRKRFSNSSVSMNFPCGDWASSRESL